MAMAQKSGQIRNQIFFKLSSYETPVSNDFEPNTGLTENYIYETYTNWTITLNYLK